MREVFQAKPHFRYNPVCRECKETGGSSRPVWEEQPGMGIGAEYRMLVAPKCKACGAELSRVADAPVAPDPEPDPVRSFIDSIPPFGWAIIVVIVLLVLMGNLGSR